MNEQRSDLGSSDGQEDQDLLNIDSITEQIYTGLSGLMSRVTIREVLNQVISKYADARIRIYVPIFVRRDAESRLRSMVGSRPSSEAPSTEAYAGQKDSDQQDTIREGVTLEEQARKAGTASMRLKAAG